MLKRKNTYDVHVITTTDKRHAFRKVKRYELFDHLEQMYSSNKIILYEVDTKKIMSEPFLMSLLENNEYYFTISEAGAKYIVKKICQ